jgi:hypothetical protein
MRFFYTVDNFESHRPAALCASSYTDTVNWITKSTTFIELVIFGGKQFNRFVGIAYHSILSKMVRRPSACLGHCHRRHAILKQNKSTPADHPQQNDPFTRG